MLLVPLLTMVSSTKRTPRSTNRRATRTLTTVGSRGGQRESQVRKGFLVASVSPLRSTSSGTALCIR